MGLLEQLELEAEQQRRAAARAAAEQQQRLQTWAEQVLPGMRSLDLFLQRLVADLQRVQPVSRLVADLPGYGAVVAYSDHDYRLQSRLDDGTYEISLRFGAEIASDECPMINADGVATVTAVAAALWQHRLFGVMHARKNAHGEATSAVFRARGRILCRLRIVADQASRNIQLQFTNIDGFGQTTHVWTADDLSPQRFDWFGELICGRTRRESSGQPPLTPRERRSSQRRGGMRTASGPFVAPGRRLDDRVAAARLRPYLGSGAQPNP